MAIDIIKRDRYGRNSSSEADFFQCNLAKSVFIAVKTPACIQDFYPCQLSSRVVVNSDAFGKMFGSYSSFFKTDIEGIDMGVIGNSHISSFLRIVDINRHYHDFIFFNKYGPNLFTFVKFSIPLFVKRKFLYAFHAAKLSRFPFCITESLYYFFFSTAAKVKLFFGMFAKMYRFTDVFHRLTIARMKLCVKYAIGDRRRIGQTMGVRLPSVI